jgi:hypothetical protein
MRTEPRAPGRHGRQVGGMLITALMLGIVSDAIGSRMDELRKGKSEVLEAGHTLILGWSDKLLPLVREFLISHAHTTIVIMADRHAPPEPRPEALRRKHAAPARSPSTCSVRLARRWHGRSRVLSPLLPLAPSAASRFAPLQA